ncbi:conjugative transposon protein TraM [Mucilaginibacter ginsenosidivorans]|uniref:Conjugative transposon protein TraM n=1 Tax=Mucilaginibacter ginsenosidivorans TaxID=398053 RepID=A0A5B8UTV0_9SPHI|nr:conjugative transposon protein TraM [Mucilaginibacter ginsenosidivorans]QEC62454.1 conjugative transposon protein TraM [Mucilaginibacter ginsenosidivorans]
MNHTIQFKRTRKLLLFLPLLIVPLLSFAFWKLNSSNPSTNDQTKSQGLNTRLPDAKFDKHAKTPDKMSFYQQAVQDSGKARLSDGNPLLQKFGFKPKSAGGAVPNPLLANNTDPNVGRINQKLAEINRQISQPQPVNLPSGNGADNIAHDKSFSQQVSKLETMMKTMNSGQQPDPQMQQLSGMLDKIQAIQRPETTKSKPAESSVDTPFKATPAIVDGNQRILQGGVVRLRLTDTIRVKGALVSKGQLLFGSCNITNQRLLLDIKNIRLGHSIIPVSLTVFSLDGLPGIPAPEAELTGAAGEGANNALQDMQLLSMDQSLATQAASAGIDAAKGLLSKKVRRVKVRLKNGFPILLRNNQGKP